MLMCTYGSTMMFAVLLVIALIAFERTTANQDRGGRIFLLAALVFFSWFVAPQLWAQPPSVPPPPATPPLPKVFSKGLAQCKAQALREKKPIAVWVGFQCHYSALTAPELVHYQHTGNTYKGVRGPCVIVMVHRGGTFWYFDRCVIKSADCSANHLRRMARITRRDLGLCDCADTGSCTCHPVCHCPQCKHRKPAVRVSPRMVQHWRAPLIRRPVLRAQFCPT